eukprot:TRINITY_DN9750_c0_g3_i1.p1 TRINITY_DN9750_c0_g3~~TRINITY_DN9750_c0_g3_i1.p1  ORF type:complete len:199 (+),score=39.49 TRINITY_DN9750_c0_g3_i1:57-653(+)
MATKTKGLQSKAPSMEKKRSAKTCTAYARLTVPVQGVSFSLKTIRPKLLKKIMLKSAFPLYPPKPHSNSVMSRVYYRDQETLPIVKPSQKSPYLIEGQPLSELAKKSLIVAGAVKITPQPSVKAALLQHTLKILNDRAEDVARLKESKRTERKLVGKITAREKLRWKVEKMLIVQLKGERIHEKGFKKYLFIENVGKC